MDSAKPHFIELVWLKETGSMGEAKKVLRGRPKWTGRPQHRK